MKSSASEPGLREQRMLLKGGTGCGVRGAITKNGKMKNGNKTIVA